MKSKLMYVELKSGYADDGPAWIGRGFFSKSGKTIYFNGNAYKAGQGITGNHYEIESGDEYWISGVKKNGWDRHWAGTGKVIVDKAVVDEYLDFVGWRSLPEKYYVIEPLINTIDKEKFYKIENERL